MVSIVDEAPRADAVVLGGVPFFGAPTRLSQSGRVDDLVALEAQLARLQARQVRVLAAMADDRFADAVAARLEKQWVREDVRAALGESAVGAGDRLAVAQALTHRLPGTLCAMERGELSYRKAVYLVEQTAQLDDEAACEVEGAALAVTENDVVSFRRVVRRAVLAADPRAAEAKHRAALSEREVTIRAAEDGMSSLWGLLPAEGAALVDSALDFMADHAAQAGPDDGRTRAQRRADALVELARDVLAGGCAHCRRPARPVGPAVQVTVALSTLLGLDEQPGELAGHGPIPAGLARRIAADESGTWRRLVTDPLGQLLDYGRSTYRPPAELARFVRAHDSECVFPGCHRHAETCELDHTIAWEQGGKTNAENLKPLCPRNHHAKHDGGWQLTRLADGSLEWTSPTGHHYRKKPTSHPIDHTHELIKDQETADQPEHPATEADPDPPDTPPF